MLFVQSGHSFVGSGGPVGRFERQAGETVDEELQAAVEAEQPGRIAELIATGILGTSQGTLTEWELGQMAIRRGK